jgi:dolichol kinase
VKNMVVVSLLSLYLSRKLTNSSFFIFCSFQISFTKQLAFVVGGLLASFYYYIYIIWFLLIFLFIWYYSIIYYLYINTPKVPQTFPCDYNNNKHNTFGYLSHSFSEKFHTLSRLRTRKRENKLLRSFLDSVVTNQ